MGINMAESLTPAFQFGEPNKSVFIAKDTVAIEIDGSTYIGNGEVRLDLIPQAAVHIYSEFQGIPPSVSLPIFLGQKEITSFAFCGKRVDGFSLGLGGEVQKQEAVLKWLLEPDPMVGRGNESTAIQQLVFHLFNFKDFIGIRRSSEQRGSSLYTIEHVELVSDSWRVELRSLVETRDNIKKLNAEGGYGLTHVGLLKKPDGATFAGKDAEEALHALKLFFSFAKGIWCNPLCAVGFDASGNRIWESWSSPEAAWHSAFSWFDPHHSEQLTGLFPGFITKWNHEDWREALTEVIYWYQNSNSSRGIDAGIILTQAAIERLSYEYSVKDRKLIEANGFKDLRASDKLRLLFSSLDIPIDIPNSLPEMTKLAKQFKWIDSPHALTEIRNSLVHPENRRRGHYSDIYAEAWNLGLWYLELALLRICGYSGSYSNRLASTRWVGTVEEVPWQR